MRGIILVILSITITGAAAFYMLNRDAAFEGRKHGASIGGLPADRQAGLPKTTPLSELETRIGTDDLLPHPLQVPPLPARPAGGLRKESDGSLSLYLEIADKYLDEALPLVEPKDRFVLIEKINGFKDNYESALDAGGDLVAIMRATARYIAEWNPFYYYIHQDARTVLGSVIKTLERNRTDMLGELAKRDAKQAGRLATEDMELYIEDIRKSAARRNSDFITFSLQDYEGYRKVFDELTQSHGEFLFGFAESAHVLFDDFYRMHEEVDADYSDKTRKKVEDVRLELRDLHKKALVEFARADASSARAAHEATMSAIESELSAQPPPPPDGADGGWRAEIHDIMKSDYEFYKNIQL